VSVATWHPAYVGVGSNLREPANQVRSGIRGIGNVDECVVVLRSSLYRSKPMGPADQPDFVNAVVALLTKLAPAELLSRLQVIENEHGRERGAVRWGARTLDLDLLSYAAARMSTDDLVLPHPGIAERNFVLLPWQEISPHYRVPGLGTVAELAGRVSRTDPSIECLGAIADAS
jgi:2-amino-4-hydroxy-6-hydroxymethyldihydropteridine diphosphokinase